MWVNTDRDESRHIAVVGAGIVGASVAYHVSRLGASVTLIDKSLPASGATSASFAWIGKPGMTDDVDASTPLRRMALDEWRRISGELPDIKVRWTGSIVWDDASAPITSDRSTDEEIIDDAQIRQLEPRLRTAPSRALRNLRDGAVDPVSVADELVHSAEANGADIWTGTTATSLDVMAGRVIGVRTSRGVLRADAVVIAAGADAPLLLEPFGIDLPLSPSPAILLRFTAPPQLVRTLVCNKDIEARQTSDGLLLVPLEYGGETTQDDLARAAERTLRHLEKTFVVKSEELHLVDIRVGVRPMPTDGMPLIGALTALPGAYLAVMHSGVTLAPVVGRLVADELVNGSVADELRCLRPLRAQN